ncbi:MAG: ribonucleoside triphosphate reductase [Verrucomicrobiota bacterium JB022]|nr:ribonucleoside triphosphate reductase [Verrucomicrobiota bacterium JB022]
MLDLSPNTHLQAYLASKTGLFSQVKKRDGRIAPFDTRKITASIAKAGAATGEFGEDMALRLAVRVVEHALTILTVDVPTVEQIQDMCEEVLLASPFRATARAFIVYREQHARLREIQQAADVDKVDQYLSRLDWEVKENSNMSFSLQGLNHYLSSSLSKSYWLRKVYSSEVRDAHEHGDFHIHDLNLISVYCVGWDLFDLLKEGFRGVSGKLESRPAKHFRAALGQVVNFFYTLQGEAAGAQAFSSFDTLLAPYIRYDKLSDAELKQALQEFMFNVNVPTRVGFQTPFTNVTLDLKCPSHYRDHPVIRGGELQPETYGEFQAEMDRFNKALFELYADGDARGRILTFPIPTINLTKDFDWDNPEHDPLWEMTAKYGVPYFSNFINSDMDPEDARSMCCRLRIDNTQLDKRGGGLFGAHPLTGSVGVVTINMPRLGHLATNEQDFYARLARLMDLARDSLEVKRKLLERLTDGGLYPYTTFYLRDIKERRGTYWANHFSTIGLLGMNEACANLFGEDIGTERGQAFARDVLDFMRERLVSYQQETGHLYNLEATPGESTTYRFAQADRDRFPDIQFANDKAVRELGAEPFYTNSTHLPVNYTEDIFEALDKQDDLQTRYTGGTVLHLFLGERIRDLTITKRLIRRVAESYHLPYFSLTPTFSVCAEHGYLNGEHANCPHCGRQAEIYSRVVGYLRPVEQWNAGKQAEFDVRREYEVREKSASAKAAKEAQQAVG